MIHTLYPHSPDTSDQAQIADGDRPLDIFSPIVVSLLYLLGHVALDRFSLALTKPWATVPAYLPAGLSLALLIAGGLRYLPLTLLTTLSTETVFAPSWPVPIWPAVLETITRTAGQGLVAVLLPQDVTMSNLLQTLRDVVWFTLTVLGAPILIITLSMVGILILDSFPGASHLPGHFAAWSADIAGIMTVTPFFLACAIPWAQQLRRRIRRSKIQRLISASWRSTGLDLMQMALEAISIVFILWIAFGSRFAKQYHLGYLCFLPLLWLALHYGLPRITTGILFINLGVTMAAQQYDHTLPHVTELQILLVTLACTGLFVGAMVRARRRSQQELKQNETRLKRHAQELNVLNHAARTFSSSLDLDRVLGNVLEEVRSQMDVVAGSLWLKDKRTGEMVCQQATGPRRETVQGWRLKPGEGLIGWVAEHGESLITPDATTDPRHYAGVDEQTGLSLRAMLTVPLQIEEEVIGVLQLVDRRMDRFNIENLRFMESLSGAAAIAIENALLYKKAQREIAERKQTEQALRESENRFRLMANTAPVMIWMAGPDGGCTYFNQPWLDFRGRCMEEERGDGWADGVHPEDLEHCLSTYHTALDTQEPFSMEYRLQRADGTYRWIFDKGSPRFLRDGRFVGFIGACTDITALKETQQALQRSEARYRAVVEEQTELVCRFLPDTTITFVNQAYCRYFEQSCEALMGQSFLSLIPEEDQDFARKQIGVLSPQHPINTCEHRVRLSNGDIHWQRWTDRAILDKHGHITEIQSVGRDITQRKRIEQALQKAEREKAIILNATAERFVYYDTNLRVQWANRAAGASVGQHPEALVERHCYEIWHQSTEPCESCPVLRALATGEPHKGEITAPDGRIWHLRGYPVFEEGEIIGLVEFGQDITERKRAEARSAREAQRSAALLRVAAQLSGHLTRDDFLDTLCKESAQALSTASAAVLLYNHEQRQFTLDAHSGLPAVYGRDYHPPSQLIYEQVMKNDGIFVVADAALASDLPNYDIHRRHDVRTIMGMSITYKDELLGVLTVNTVGEPRAFTEEELALLGGIADQAAQALVNAELFEQVRAGQRHLELLSRRLVEAQETERHHLARELHDEIGQALTVLKINLQALESAPDAATTRQHLESSLEIVEQALQQVRDLSLNLRPSLLDDLGLVPALRWFVDHQAQQAEFTAHFVADEIQTHFPPDLEIAYFRIAQEAMTNVMRHAHAQHVYVEIRKRDSTLEMAIRDDGIGFNVEAVLDTVSLEATSMGLLNMQERALLIGSQIDISSTLGEGTEIRVYTDLRALNGATKQPASPGGA